jgi:hypothetical protein
MLAYTEATREMKEARGKLSDAGYKDPSQTEKLRAYP